MRKLVLLVAVMLASCRTAATPTPTPPAPVLLTATPAPTLPPVTTRPAPSFGTPAPPSHLTVAAPDGTLLAASFYPPTSAAPVPGVLLLHSLDSVGGCACRADWEAFAVELQKDGFAALALDLRGHGDSPRPEDWNKAPGDVRAAWDVLVKRPEVDGQPSAIVGASIGANLALIVGANNNDVVTVIALSPGSDYHGLKPGGVLSNFGQRPVFFTVSQGDGYSYDSVQQMLPLLSQEEVFFAASGHGTQMFSDAALAPALLGWLEKVLALKG